MFSNVFPKIVSFTNKCRKIWWSQRGRSCQNSGAMRGGLVRLHAPAQVSARAPTLTTSSTKARTGARLHAEICKLYCFSMVKVAS
jgi:hypothetical protein